jgi:TnpA family transposase
VNTRQRRLQILGNDEIEAIYRRPRFTDEDRIQYFSLSQPERDLLALFRSTKSKVYFILQLGYFKARPLFFTFDLTEVPFDVSYVLSQHFNNSELHSLSPIDKHTRLRQQHLILELFDYRNCDAPVRDELEIKAQQLASVCVKPVYIYRELMNYLSKERIVAPGYSFMQDTVGKALSFEQQRLTTIIRTKLSEKDISALNALLSNEEGLYEITSLRREPKDFNLSEVKREINRGQQIQSLHHLAKKLLPSMNISAESIKYYASLVSYYSVYKLKRFEVWTAYIYLLCFVYHRYQRHNDNLINCLIYNVRQYADEAKAAAKERVYQLNIESNENLKKAAGIVAWGTNMGLLRMGENCDLPYQTLTTTSDNFIRLETLGEANDRISNAIAKLDIFGHYDIDGHIHSSRDGQKFETKIPTINARYSPKYFGLKKGIVSYTLVANHIPVNAQIIGANEHESHYVFDILKNNTTEIQPSVHSTDTHGTNEVNFAILHLFGYQFAPRYSDIADKVTKSLYGFQHPSMYGEKTILPIRKINTQLIIDEWENIGRIIVSLAMKTTTQSIIVSKLNAYARKNKTRRALWEYDNIIKSLYLLDYIDSPPLRQNVQRALNRGENYHQLRRAISIANFGKLRFKTEHQQQIWNECARLIANCIIYYNATILSNLLNRFEENGESQAVAKLLRISPVAWQHINLCGRYEFTNEADEIDIDAIVKQLAASEQIHIA